MRTITIAVGVLLMATGIWTFANSGVTFLALAFVLGIVMILDGAIEGGIYLYARGGVRKDNNIWMLANNAVTFCLGLLVLSGQLAADVAVPYVFGMWMLSSGMIRLTVALNIDRIEKKQNFWWTFGIGAVSVVAAFAGFFNDVVIHAALGELLGIYFVIQAAATIEIGFHMPHVKISE